MQRCDMPSTTDANPKPRSQPRGRPRRLSLEQIIDAALNIGLEDMTVQKVADALGVARAVLYNYVGSREELAQIATANLANAHPFPKDIGQPWDAYVRDYAGALHAFFSRHGTLVKSYVDGALGPLIQTEGAEMWLSVLTREGFTGTEALRLQEAIEAVVLGSALNRAHALALTRAGESYAAIAREAVAKRGHEALPLVSRHVEAFAGKGDPRRWERAVGLLIAGAAATKAGST
jgi:AcrR family transcriptional regulator